MEGLRQLVLGDNPWQIAIELIVIGLCVYLVLRFLQGTRGAGVIKGVALVLIVSTLGIRVLGQATDAFERVTWLYERLLGLVAIMLIVVFQPELRQAMVRLGHAWNFRISKEQRHGVIDAIVPAVEFLSKNQFGALIAIERHSGLGGLADSGTSLDAEVSAALLQSIFWPNSPLHDLGTIIRGDRVVAASVQFPLAEEGALPPQYGSRHRAAVGVTLESDCVVVIVSEETGRISMAEQGRLVADLTPEQLRELLSDRLDAPPDEVAAETAVVAKEASQGKVEQAQVVKATAGKAGAARTVTRTAGAGR